MILPGYLKALIAQQERQDGAWWGRPGNTYEGKLGPWNTLVLDGKVFPGADDYNDPRACSVRLSGRVRYRLDIQRAKKGGHKIVVEGYQPEPLTFVAKFWRAEQWAAFEALMPDINPKLKSNKRRAYSASCAVLNTYKIDQIYLNDIEFPQDGEHRMIQVVRLHGMEVFDIQGAAPKKVAQTDLNDDARTGLDPKFDFDAKPRAP